MTQQQSNKFPSLISTPQNPLILYNIWDAGSAKTIEKKIINKVKNPVIATSSWAVAESHGYKDGEQYPFQQALENLKEIVRAVKMPVSFDFESGFAVTPQEVAKNVIQVINCQVKGINFEDQIIGQEAARYSIEDQCERIKAIRKVVDSSNADVFINARTDIFLQKNVAEHNEKDLHEAIERNIAYAKAGAHGYFVPGLINKEFIKKLCDDSPIPINIMVDSDVATKGLTDIGVSRISYGPFIYIKMLSMLEELVN